MHKKKKPVKIPKKKEVGLSKKFINTLKSRKQKQADILKELGF